jgi:hypothetical protein
MSREYDPIAELFEPARKLEPRAEAITRALTRAVSRPPRSAAYLRIANLLKAFGAVFVLIVAFAVVEARGFGGAVSKQRVSRVELVDAARPATAVNLAALERVLRGMHTGNKRTRRNRPHRGAPANGTGVAPAVEPDRATVLRAAGAAPADPARVRARRARLPRRSRCACERQSMRPPPRASVAKRSRILS